MILHLGENVSVDMDDIIMVMDLTNGVSQKGGAMMREIRRQDRVLVRQGIHAKSAVLCGGARKAGGEIENPRLYLTQISTWTLAQRTREKGYPDMDANQQIKEPQGSGKDTGHG